MSNTTYNAVDNIIPKTELYVCETCGKKVYERYGSNRFCCVTCARKYSSRFGNSKEGRRKKSETLKKRYPSKPKSTSPKKKSSKQKNYIQMKNLKQNIYQVIFLLKKNLKYFIHYH